MANFGQTEKNQLAGAKKSLTQLLDSQDVKGRFESILKSKAPGFISSILNTVNSSEELKKVSTNNPMSIIRSTAVAAALDLPIDKNLGFAWIVPYREEAQFQLGYKGYIQLALRTGQYRKINAVPVCENQFKSWNALTETLEADFGVDGEGEIVGFAVYFELINGFTKLTYWTKKQLLEHGKKYSKTFNSNYSPWKSNTDAMCLKTAIKLTIAKWGILSIEMQTAIKADQAVIKADDLNDNNAFEYVDGTEDGNVIDAEGSARTDEHSQQENFDLVS
jgi:recombination protein RecT